MRILICDDEIKNINDLKSYVEEYMNKVNEKIGTNYGLVNYYGAPDATKVLVAMGSVCETIEETIDYLTKQGEKVGLIKVHLYRPFPVYAFLKAVPETCKKIAVLEGISSSDTTETISFTSNFPCSSVCFSPKSL